MKQGKKAVVIVTALALVASGCAGYRPLVDARGVDPARYEWDLQECQQYAATEDPGAHAAAGIVIGALLGLALAVAGGARGNGDRGHIAALGAVAGGAGGLSGGAQTQIQIVQRCMAGRGYSVLR